MSSLTPPPLLSVAILTMLVLLNEPVKAAGFALVEQNVSGLGNAYAGAAASAEDASTIYFNPAGMTYLQGNQLVVAGHIVNPSAKFTGAARDPLGNVIGGGNGGDAGAPSLVPNLYYSRHLPSGFRFGLGINVPFGLKTEYDSGWAGRYHAIESEVKTININPAIAYKAAPNLSVGVGVNVQYIEATLTQAVNSSLSCVSVVQALFPGTSVPAALATCGGFGISAATPDAYAEVEGDDWSYGYNFGLLYEVSPGSRVGFAYRSKIKQELEGHAQFSSVHSFFTGNSLFIPTDVTANVTLPESASLSLYHDINNQWAVLADATWTHWNRFQQLLVDFDNPRQTDSLTVEDWTNSMRYSLGFNYRYDSAWLLRAGIAFDEEPIRNAQYRTPRIPGNDRTWLAIGANFRYSSNLSFDAGYAHLIVDDTSIDHTSTSAGPITGTYDNNVDIVSAQVNWTF